LKSGLKGFLKVLKKLSKFVLKFEFENMKKIWIWIWFEKDLKRKGKEKEKKQNQTNLSAAAAQIACGRPPPSIYEPTALIESHPGSNIYVPVNPSPPLPFCTKDLAVSNITSRPFHILELLQFSPDFYI
jgi:hypothetical protein